MKRTVSLVLVLAMLCTALLGVTSFAEATETGTPELVISQANLQFADTVYLLIAVDYTAVYGTLDEAKAAVTLNVKNTADETSEIVNLKPDSSVVLAGHVCFTYKDLGAKNMGDELELTAINGTNDSVSKTFSVLEYAISAKGYSDSLDLVCETMIEYGEAAQTAWGWKDTATYDLSKDWGLLVVKGSNEGKAIAEVGSSATFTPNTAKTGDNAALYNMSAAKLDSTGTLTVPEGSSEYYFIGDAQRTIINFDFTTADAALSTDTSLNTQNVETDTKKANLFSSLTSTGGLSSAVTGTNGTTRSGITAQIYGITTANNRKGTLTSSIVTGENGYWKFETPDQAQSLAIQLDANHDKVVSNMEGGVFTMVWTLGKDGTTKMPTSANRFRGSSSSNVSSFFMFGNDTTNHTSTLYALENGYNKFDNESYKPTAIATIQGEAGKQSFLTFYIVVDMNKNTFTYYADGVNGSVTTNANSAANKTLKEVMSTGTFIDWTMAPLGANSAVLLQRFLVLEGNIFE